MLVIFLVVAGALGLCLLIGVGIGNFLHMLTSPRAKSRSAPAKALAQSTATASPNGEVSVGPIAEPTTAAMDTEPPHSQNHPTEPSLAQALAMEHVNS